MPDGTGLSEVAGRSIASQAAQAAGTVTRGLVGRTVADVERDLILDTLDHVLGNRTHAANILGISIRTLRNKLNQYTDEGVPRAGARRTAERSPSAWPTSPARRRPHRRVQHPHPRDAEPACCARPISRSPSA